MRMMRSCEGGAVNNIWRPMRCINLLYLYNLNDDDFKTELNKYKINDDLLLPSNTLFNYPSFIKYLNPFNITISIEKWFSSAVVRTLTTEKKLSSYFIQEESKLNFKILINFV